MAKAQEIQGLAADLPFALAAARTVEVRAQEVFDHAVGVLDTSDIERVHAMRVATRRLRAVLEIYEPCFPRRRLRPVLRDVKRLADALGERRDPDVELLALEQFAASVGPDERGGVERFIERTRAEQHAANAALRTALAQAERHGLRERLLELARDAEGRAGDGDRVDVGDGEVGPGDRIDAGNGEAGPGGRVKVGDLPGGHDDSPPPAVDSETGRRS
ncbi:MAG: CHAD domain-containing protein [Solirubrobacteraceae bacterium]|nr:CHAD domain-containing protein [Solirubrobacteraceae bacterium]